jgi:hypothetical protein
MKEKVSAFVSIFNKAYNILNYALENSDNELIKKTALEKFDYTSQVFFKTIGLYLELEGKHQDSMERRLKEAKSLNLFDDEGIYFELYKNRNHEAIEINEEEFKKIHLYSENMKIAIDKLYFNLINSKYHG